MRNLLFITVDQERWFATDPAPLPGHERLRAAGTSFDRFYAAALACSPARSVMYTGEHSAITGVIENVGPGQDAMRTDLPTLGHRLRDRGYVTSYKGKWHLSFGVWPPRATGPLPDALEDYGFADYNEEGDDLGLAYEGFESDGRIADSAATWLGTIAAQAARDGRPWALCVNFVNPHDVMYGTTDPEILKRNTAGMSLGGRHYAGFTGPPDDELYAASWDLPDEASWHQPIDEDGRPDAHQQFGLGMTMLLGYGARTDGELRRFRDYYINCIRDMDRAVVRVLDALDASGMADDTVVVFVADHGEMAGNHNLFGKGPCSYDENIRIPLIIVDPAKPGGVRSQALGTQLDLLPTMLSLVLGDAAPSELPGHDLGSCVGSSDARNGRSGAVFMMHGLMFLDGEWMVTTPGPQRNADPVTGRDFSKHGQLRTLVTDRYKFSRYFSPADYHVPTTMEDLAGRNTLELFDLGADPHEMHNMASDLSGSTGDLVADLNGQLNELIGEELGDDDGRWLPQLDGAPWVTTN